MSLAKQITSTFGTKVISFFFSFISSIFLTRLLGSEGKGVQAFIFANVALFSSFLGFNILQTLTYFIAKKDFDVDAARGFALLICTGAILFFTAGILILFYTNSSIIDFIIPHNYQTLFFVVYLLILFINGISLPFFDGNWQGQAKFNIINSIGLFFSLLNALIFLGVWLMENQNILTLTIEEILTISLIVTLLSLLIRIVVFVLSKDNISFRFEAVLKPMLQFTGLGWSIGILNFLVRRIDVWFVEHFNGVSALGRYALSASLLDVLLGLLLPATFVLSPYLTNTSKKRRVELIGRFSRISVLAFSILCLLIILICPLIIPFAYGSEFEKSVIPTQILFTGGAFILFRNIFAVFNISVNNLKPNLYGVITSLIVTIILDLILIPQYGIIGASIATMCAYITSTCVIVWLALKELDTGIRHFILFNMSDYIFIKSKIKIKLQELGV